MNKVEQGIRINANRCQGVEYLLVRCYAKNEGEYDGTHFQCFIGADIFKTNEFASDDYRRSYSTLQNNVEYCFEAIAVGAGGFSDPDFGFEYWNHEYSNVHYREFNNEQTGLSSGGLYNEITKKECQESIRQSLSTYAPQLKQVFVSMELNSAEAEKQRKKKVPSKYVVTITVEGIIDDGLGNYV